ncbi:MAG: hypothetical protein ACLRQF_10605 [Thomasclavelia ramosa]
MKEKIFELLVMHFVLVLKLIMILKNVYLKPLSFLNQMIMMILIREVSRLNEEIRMNYLYAYLSVFSVIFVVL